MSHCGQDLTPFLADLDWAKLSNIKTGGDYLCAILASILRDPFKHTPYLFFHGPENSGKSILWEAVQNCLVTGGVIKADRCLDQRNPFSGELLGAVFCVIEEKNIAKTPGALARIKDFVTSPIISLRPMFGPPFQIPNCTHWFQFANQDESGEAFCPVLPGDSRITSIWVPSLPPGKLIPKEILMKRLEQEAPAFLYTLLNMTLPPPTDRLAIPVVETEEKKRLQTASAPLLAFVDDCLLKDDEAREPKAAVQVCYRKWAQTHKKEVLDPIPFGKELRKAVPSIRDGKTKDGKRVDAYLGIKLLA
jgi:phage/plasmid-associated DNA primase